MQVQGVACPSLQISPSIPQGTQPGHIHNTKVSKYRVPRSLHTVSIDSSQSFFNSIFLPFVENPLGYISTPSWLGIGLSLVRVPHTMALKVGGVYTPIEPSIRRGSIRSVNRIGHLSTWATTSSHFTNTVHIHGHKPVGGPAPREPTSQQDTVLFGHVGVHILRSKPSAIGVH